MSTTNLTHLQTCLSLARKSPPKPTNFRVGALLLLRQSNNNEEDKILSTGYTLELPGNTHAEQCCLAKYASSHSLPEERVGEVLPPPPDSTDDKEVVLYVTMEPCGKRLSGNLPCVQRIIQTRSSSAGGKGGIRKVYFGVKEPGTFVGESEGCRMLSEAGVEWEVVGGLEEEILGVAKEGHESKEEQGTNVDDISPEERRRQEQLPRNPKKRMMEV